MSSKRDMIRQRAAAIAAVNAYFDVLEASTVERIAIHPPSKPDGEYSQLDKARADAIAKRHGIG